MKKSWGSASKAEVRAQLSARSATRLRGSGGPLPLAGDRIEPEKDDKTRWMTPVGVFFLLAGRTREALSTAPQYVQFYNELRPHRTLKYKTPQAFEEAYWTSLS